MEFYPGWLWEPADAPLHFLVGLRRNYLASSGDPFFNASSAVHSAPWFRVFVYIEGLVQFPLAAFLVSQLASRRRMTGAAELAGLAFGCLTFMGSAACCFELLHMGPDEVAAEKKGSLLYGTYLPFVVIRKLTFSLWVTKLLIFYVAAVLAVDMFLRLLPRVQATNNKDKDE